MKKTFKVVMLTTEKAGRISLSNDGEYLYPDDRAKNNQHLYIISDDEIKEGDWYIDDTNLVRQSITSDKDYWNRRKDYKKIVATTDKLIFNNQGLQQYLPQLPESFIQAYIKAYNEDKPITEVDLLCEEVGNKEYDGIPQTRPDNTVIVHQSKMYSRDEVEKLIHLYHKAWKERPIYEFDEDPPIPNKWIQDNLK